MVVESCPLGRADREMWDEYVSRDGKAGHCHLSRWQRVVARSYGHQPIYLWAREHGEIRGVAPLILVRSAVFGRSVVSLPYLDDGGVCAGDAESEAALVEGAVQEFRRWNGDVLDLRQRGPTSFVLYPHRGKVTMVLSLAGTADAMWQRLDGKVRNQVRKATKSGLSVSWSGREGIDAFYGVFAENMRDLGSPVHARHFFSAILEEFPESTRVVLVRKGDVVLGAGLCLWFRDGVAMPWASSLRAYASLCPNILLYWEVIRWACEKRFRRFDFGRSSPGSGTYRFKRQWGAVEEPLQWQYLARKSSRTPTLDSMAPQHRMAIRIWRRLPLWLSNRVGPMLRRGITN